VPTKYKPKTTNEITKRESFLQCNAKKNQNRLPNTFTYRFIGYTFHEFKATPTIRVIVARTFYHYPKPTLVIVCHQ